jgi:hypothetical protein
MKTHRYDLCPPLKPAPSKPAGHGGDVVNGGGAPAPYKTLFWMSFLVILVLVSAGVVHMYFQWKRRRALASQLGQHLIDESFDGTG